MEKSEVVKPVSEDASNLNRNRSFKSKQLVRSQAIRESQSPPRTVSPSPNAEIERPVKNNVVVSDVTNNVNNGERSDVSDESETKDEGKKQPVEIQITGGAWDESSERGQRTRRWLGHSKHSDSSRDLLSNNPRVACVCGACAACPHCRGRRRRHICTIKQDSGIACSDDCPDCSDTEISGIDGVRKSDSVEVDEQTYYCRCPERKEKPKSISLSRTDSEEKSEPTGIELVNFIKETLNKNARDRMTLLKIEKELHALVNDTGRCIVRFPVMTSYGRMLVHRCAALFQLSHHLDQTNKTSVLVSKSGTSGGRIPCTSFRQWCTVSFPSASHSPAAHTHAKSILKRDTNSLDEPGNGALSNSRSKSLEQRERDYERMKRRIFSSDNCSQDESQWPWVAGGGPVKLLTPDTGRNKLVKVQSLESGSQPGGQCRGRGAVSKSHSFGGYGAAPPPLAAPAAPTAPAAPPPPRLLSRQGDLASSSWRLSPSSSGYKTLSLRSTDSVTPSPTGGASPEPGGGVCAGGGAGGVCAGGGSGAGGVCAAGGVVCAVTDLAAVPPGALVLHPQTGRPLTNPDGSLYHFDPSNPPLLYDQFAHDVKIDQNNEKKRGKLEKQHSFIDHDSECQPSEETRSKCCCDCRRSDSCQQKSTDKNTIDQKCQPQSPSKNRYDTENTTETRPPYEPANQKSPPFEMTNQRSPYNTPANETPYETYERHESNQRASYDATANHRPPYEPPANQRLANDVTGQRLGKLANQESQEMYHQQYSQMRNDEVTSPGQNHYMQQEASVHPLQKTTPAPVPDPSLRPVSLTNMAYPATMPQPYPYINQFRMEHPVHMYQPALSAGDQKQLTHQEPTFRIDPSYPYAALDYASQCGACLDPSAMRSYNVSYGQVEMPQAVLPPSYPVSNVVLPQPHIQHYPYQEAVQWQPPLVPLPPKIVPEVYHPVYPGVYQYSVLYPQVIPQPYPICQPIYQPEPGRSSASSVRHKRDSITDGDARPHDANGDKMANRRNSSEIAAKIQQIKEQMSRLSAGGSGGGVGGGGPGGGGGGVVPRDDRRRNNGAGILGSCPGHAGKQRLQGRPTNDETQLSPAARAIVNSIRTMQAKTNYQDNRREYYRPDRPRRPERDERGARDDRGMRDDRQHRPPYAHRQQMSPGTWNRRSPAPVQSMVNHNPRRPPQPDNRNGRR